MRVPLRLIILLSVFSAFLFLANAVVYEAWAAMFGLNGWVPALVVGGVQALLSATFILSTFLGTKYYSALTRTYYRVSAVWVGMLAYLFLAASAYGIIVYVVGGLAPQAGFACMAAAVLTSAYGYWHASRIKIREVQVRLANLPAAWEGRRLAFISDVHLGQIYNERRLEHIVATINNQAPDLVCIGGDLFDGTTAPDLYAFAAPLAKLDAPWGTYFITGNHEEYGNIETFIDAVRKTGVRVLVDEMVDIEGVQLIGVDYKNTADKDAFEEILNALAIDRDKPSILLRHEPKDLEVGRDAGISLQLSGHTHLGQQWPFIYLAQATYKGFAYGLKALGSMQVYTSSGVGTWGPPMRVGTESEVVVITFGTMQHS